MRNWFKMVVLNNNCIKHLLVICIMLFSGCYAVPPFLGRTAAALPKGREENVFGVLLIGSQIERLLTGWDSRKHVASPFAPFWVHRSGLGNNMTCATIFYSTVVMPPGMGFNWQWQFLGYPQDERPALSKTPDVALDIVVNAAAFADFINRSAGIGLVSSMPISKFTGYASYHYYFGDLYDNVEHKVKASFRVHAFTAGLKNEATGYFYELFISQAEDYKVDDIVDARAISFAVGKEF